MNKETVENVVNLKRKIDTLHDVIIAYDIERPRNIEMRVGNRRFTVGYDITVALMDTIRNLKEVYEKELENL